MDARSRIKGVPKNPWEKGTFQHRYYDLFTKVTAPSDSDIVKSTYKETGHLTSTNALHVFRSYLRSGNFTKLDNKPVPVLAMQPRSCSAVELAAWIRNHVR